MRTLLIASFALYTSYAAACSYQIDQVSKSSELQKVAEASLGLPADQVNSRVSAFTFFESKPTPMCPEELTYKAVVDVAYRAAHGLCQARLQVTKVESWGVNAKNVYSVTGHNSARCSR